MSAGRYAEHTPEPEPGPTSQPRGRRVLLEPGGPVLVEGPVEVELPDGSRATSDRFMVALCACRRSRSYPWCDASHRRPSRPTGREARPADPGASSDPGPSSASGDGAGSAGGGSVR